MSVGAIRVDLELQDGDFVTRVTRAGESLKTFWQQLGQTTNGVAQLEGSYAGLGRSMRDGATTSGSAAQALQGLQSNATGVGTNIAKTNAEVGRMSTALKGMSGIGDPTAALKGAQKNVQNLVDATGEAPASLQAMTESFADFAAAGVDPANDSVQTLAASLAALDDVDFANPALGEGFLAGRELSFGEAASSPRFDTAPPPPTAAAQAGDSAEKADKNNGKVKTKLNEMLANWANYNEQLGNAGTHWLDTLTDKLVTFATTGKITFKDFAESILKDILRIQYQALISKLFAPQILGVGSFLDGVWGGVKSFFSGGSDTAPPSSQGPVQYDGVVPPPGQVTSALSHGGGIVGLEALTYRAVPSSLFDNAERFHSGRAPVLRADEVPTILQKDEGVFTPAQMKALARGQGGTAVQVNLINQSGQQMAAEQSRPRFDGEQMVLDIVLRAASRPGNFRDSMKGALS